MTQQISSLVDFSKVHDIPAFAKQIGSAIAKSKMFGCEYESQGEIIALEYLTSRFSLLMFPQKYHLIKGKLSMKSEAMLAELRTSGGKHKVVSRTPEKAEIEITDQEGNTQSFTLTWEEASSEPFVYEGRESEVVAKLGAGKKADLKLKAKYATRRSRMQMLWARLVSDSVRAMAPEIVSGVYSPEEVTDFEEMPAETRNNPEPSVPEREVVETEPTETTSPAEGMKAKEPPKPEEFSQPVDAPCTDEQVTAIKAALKNTSQVEGCENIVAVVTSKIKEAGFEKLADLTGPDAEKLLAAIQKKEVQAVIDASLPAKNSSGGQS